MGTPEATPQPTSKATPEPTSKTTSKLKVKRSTAMPDKKTVSMGEDKKTVPDPSDVDINIQDKMSNDVVQPLLDIVNQEESTIARKRLKNTMVQTSRFPCKKVKDR